MTANYINAIGWIGVTLILVAYALISLNIIKSTSFVFQLLNLMGAIGAGANALYYGSMPVAVLNGAWTAISVVSLFTICRRKSRES